MSLRHLILLGGIYFWPAGAQAVVVTTSVPGNAGPWMWVSGGLNTAFQYGINDQIAPTLVDATSGIDFTPGAVILVQYLSGLANNGSAISGANGDTGDIFNTRLGSSGFVGPSFYMSSADYPTYVMELVGTFADASGNIVGTPFEIGSFRALVVPTGAARLQLGVNDDIFNNNGGALIVSVTNATPEPATWVLLGSGLLLVGGLRKKPFTPRTQSDCSRTPQPRTVCRRSCS